jgi:putative FmdB family regulatory protein
MPTYEYVCRKCGHRFELFQKITDPPRKRCPECRGTVRRVIGAGAGLLFKGDGFYVTDYRSKDYQEKAKAEKSATASTGSTESKGDGKTPASPGKEPKKAADKKDSSD